MSQSLRRLFPSVAIGPAGIATVLGLDWSPETRLPCPRCTKCTTKPDPMTIPTVRDPEGGWYAGPCPSCGWAGSVFELYCQSVGLEPHDAVRSLRKAGVRVPRGCGSVKVLAAWTNHIRVLDGLKSIKDRFEGRRLAGPIHGHAVASLSLTNTPHQNPLWWCTTVSEISALVGTLLSPTATAYRRLGAATPDEAAIPTIVVPLYDRLFRLTGIVGFSPHTHGPLYYVRTRPGTTALGFLHTATQSVTKLGNVGIITSCPVRALNLICTHMITSPTPPPVVYVPDPEQVRSIASALPKRSWVYVPTGYPVLETVSSGKWVALLRHLNARVVPYTCRTVDDVAAVTARGDDVSWSAYLERIVSTVNPFDTNVGPSTVRIRTLLTNAGWDVGVGDQIRRSGDWAPHTLKQAHEAMTLLPKLRTVSAAPGLTVVEASSGWIWDETGELLAAAYPADVKTERVGGSTRYRGIIVYGSRIVPFASRRFTTSPATVITSALLRAGLDPPPIHPRLVPHLATVALYFSRTTYV